MSAYKAGNVLGDGRSLVSSCWPKTNLTTIRRPNFLFLREL